MSRIKEKEEKKSITKKVFSLSDYKENNDLNESSKDKEMSFYELSPAFKEATGLPGFAKGYVHVVRGFSDTGKSTAAFEAAVAAQKCGDIPVIMDMENNLDWKHLENMGFEYTEIVDPDTGEVTGYDGNFIYADTSYIVRHISKKRDKAATEATIEDSAKFIHKLLDDQASGKLPFNLCFIYDSVGVLNSIQTVKSLDNETSNNNQWNAGAYESSFKSILNQLIPNSRKEISEYINTLIVVNRVWEKSVAGKPVIENKGGKSFYSACRTLIHCGGVMSHGIKKINAVKNGNTVLLGNVTKLSVVKNQLGGGYGGISLEGDIISTPHGYISNTPEAIKKYKQDYLEYFAKLLGDNDFELKEDIKYTKEFLDEEGSIE
jgi:RecA/RadA recombinase